MVCFSGKRKVADIGEKSPKRPRFVKACNKSMKALLESVGPLVSVNYSSNEWASLAGSFDFHTTVHE